MRVKKRLAILLVMMLITLVSCGNAEAELIGRWIYNSDYSSAYTASKDITFYEGGSCANTGESGTWSVTNETISILGGYGGKFWSRDTIMGTFEIEGDRLIISNVSVDGRVQSGCLVYIKQN